MAGETLVSLFGKQARLTPEALAVVGVDRTLTYAALDRLSSQVAAYLQSLAIGPGDLVLVQAHRSVELIVALLAVIKTGAAFVPLDRQLPLARKEYIARQCNAALVLSTHPSDSWPILACRVETVAGILASPTAAPFRPVDVSPTDAMYVIFTSGTTGNPKGVVIEHHSVLGLIRLHNRDLEIDASSRGTLMAAVGFDLSQSEIWSQLLAGGQIQVPTDSVLLNSDEFLAFCVAHEITHAFVPTLRVYDVLNAIQPPGLKLRFIYTCGEKLHPVDVDHLSYQVVDCYGPTETTIFVTSRVVPSARLNSPASIGWPMGDFKVFVLDGDLNEVRPGEAGELCIAGDCLARGYLGAPQLTAERFVFVPALGCRVYRSGDQGRLLADGSLQFLGRQDGQVKIRGYRVEVGEIEARLLRETAIGSVAVVVEDVGTQAEKRLVAFFVPRNKSTHPQRLIAGLRRSLEADLPDYMLPSHYRCLDALPSNANGKVDKPGLLQLLKDSAPASLDLSRFSGPGQRPLAQIWFELLGHGDFDPDAHFFEVGGHSLRAAALATQASRHFRVPVTVGDIYQHLVFKALAAELARRTQGQGHEVRSADAGFEQDVGLVGDVRFAGQFDVDRLIAPRHVLLTGATGFVGVHLLAQLLATGTAMVHCPVRCDSAVAGLARLRQISERYQTPIAARDWRRVRVYVADLPEAYLGLGAADYSALAGCVEVIYHCASAVNFIMPYAYLRRDNVLGLEQIIRFAAAGQPKALMLMSTISIYSWGHRFTGKTRVLETDSIDENLPAIRCDLGYVQSKWVMEKLLDQACANGLPAMTFRLGYATCHSETGVSAHYQWWGRFIQTCLAHNAVPGLQDMREGLTTVDYMVKALAWIARKPQALGRKFNLCQSQATNLGLQAFCARVGDYYGRSLPVIPFKDWVALWENDPDEPLYPLLGMFKETQYGEETILELYQHNYHWDRSQTAAMLAGSAIVESRFEGPVLARYLQHLRP